MRIHSYETLLISKSNAEFKQDLTLQAGGTSNIAKSYWHSHILSYIIFSFQF